MATPKSTKPVDRISTLPDDIIHHILTFIPTIDSVRLSLLSRQWRHVWRSNPTLNFHHSRDCFLSQRKFYRFVKEFLKRRVEDQQRSGTDSRVTSLAIDIDNQPGLDDPLPKLLRSPKTIDNIKELYVLTHHSNGFPLEVLHSRSLTLLVLSWAKLDGLNSSVNLPSLRSVEFDKVSMCDQELSHLLSGCPSLEKLYLSRCVGLKNPKIISSCLKSFWFITLSVPIRIEAVNLQSLNLYLGGALFDFSPCQAIRDLDLTRVVVSDKLTSDIEHTFTFLESMKLTSCSTSEAITLCSRSLKSIDLVKVSICDEVLSRLLSGCPSLEKLDLSYCLGLNSPKIISPSLRSFRFRTSSHCTTICIEAVNLQSLVLSLTDGLLDFSTCEAIRDLDLTSCVVDDKLLSDIEHKFTVLESLKLTDCSTLEEITICSQSLKQFYMRKDNDDGQLVTTFETPNLVAFEYRGDLKFYISMNSPNEWLNGKIKIWPGEDENFYSGLIKFASGFNWSSNYMLTLDYRSYELDVSAVLFMKDSNGEPTWPKLNHMEVNDYKIMEGISELESRFDFFSPVPKISSSHGTLLLEAIQMILKDHHYRYLSAHQEGTLKRKPDIYV